MANDDGIDCSKDVVLTQQSAKDECDINVIIERALRGAIVPQRPDVPRYGDFTQIPTDLRDCLNTVRRADQLFMSLDAQIRKRFENDPAQMLDFLNDPKNRDEAVALGLVKAPAEPVKPDPLVSEMKGLREDLKGLKGSSGAKKGSPKDDD